VRRRRKRRRASLEFVFTLVVGGLERKGKPPGAAKRKRRDEFSFLAGARKKGR